MKVEHYLGSALEVISYFHDNSTHWDRYQKPCLAWNIKVNEFSLKKQHYEEYSLKEKWDDKWDSYADSDDELFGWCCTDGLYWIQEEVYSKYGERPNGICFSDFKLFQTGRCRGWLELQEFEGSDMEGFDITDQIKEIYHDSYDVVIREYEEITNEATSEAESYAAREVIDFVLIRLRPLYIFCKALDDFDASDAYLYALGYQRQQKEEEWDEEFEQEQLAFADEVQEAAIAV